jgi:hypothetical protein
LGRGARQAWRAKREEEDRALRAQREKERAERRRREELEEQQRAEAARKRRVRLRRGRGRSCVPAAAAVSRPRKQAIGPRGDPRREGPLPSIGPSSRRGREGPGGDAKRGMQEERERARQAEEAEKAEEARREEAREWEREQALARARALEEEAALRRESRAAGPSTPRRALGAERHASFGAELEGARDGPEEEAEQEEARAAPHPRARARSPPAALEPIPSLPLAWEAAVASAAGPAELQRLPACVVLLPASHLSLCARVLHWMVPHPSLSPTPCALRRLFCAAAAGR